MIQIPDTHCTVKSDSKKDQNGWMLFKISSYNLTKNAIPKSVNFVPEYEIRWMYFSFLYQNVTRSLGKFQIGA
jgi:hypothetical protein